MKTKFLFSLFVFCIATAVPCYGQDSTNRQSWSPAGIGVQAGIGYFAVRDDHISSEKYSGPSSWISLQWSRFHETYGYRIGMTYQEAPNIKNHNISSKATLGSFNVANLYPTGLCTLFRTDIATSLGPNAEVLIYDQQQHIAQNTDASLDVYESGALLFSMGARGELIAPVNDALQAEGSLQMSLLSFGGGSRSSKNGTTSSKLLSPFGAMHASLELALRYRFLASLSIAGGYRFDLLRVNSWNYVLAASDNGFVSLVYQP
jgi:hypothetical protein